MAANARPAGRPGRAQKQNKTDVRQQKRKRDLDDLQQLEDAIKELVSRQQSYEIKAKRLLCANLEIFSMYRTRRI